MKISKKAQVLFEIAPECSSLLQKFVISKNYYIWGLSQKGLELFFYIFMNINSREVLVHEFMLGLVCIFFFYQYIEPPLVIAFKF